MTHLIINGWNIFQHQLFNDELKKLTDKVALLKEKNPQKYTKKNITLRLAAINKLAFIDIPKDPSLKKYRQGATLGNSNKHWFRAKFFQQYRLFFRYSSSKKIIIYVWVNDEKTKRAYNSKTDAYATFKKMLTDGNPPNDWGKLMKDVT